MTNENSTPKTPAASPAAHQPNVDRTGGGTIEGDARSRQAAFGPQSTSQVRHSKGILASAKTAQGSTVSNREIGDGDIVRVGNIEMTAAQAMNHGFLTKDANGRYADVSEADAKAALDDGRAAGAEREMAQRNADLQENSLKVDSDTQSVLTEATQAVEAVGGNPVAALAEFANDPSKLPAAMQMAVEKAGADPAAALQSLKTTYDRMTAAVTDFLHSKGAVARGDAEDFFAWARENRMLQLRQAALSVPFTGDARPYLALANEWRATRSDVRERGVETSDSVWEPGSRRTVEYVTVPGFGKVEKSTAIRMGLVSAKP